MANDINLDETTNPAKISDHFEEVVKKYGMEYNNEADFYRYTIRKGMKYMLNVAYFVPELSPVINEKPVVPAFDVRDEDLHFTPARIWNACVKDGILINDWHKNIKYQIVIYELQKGQKPISVASLSGSTPSKFEDDLKNMINKLNSLIES